jgi:hypothetical protein
VLRDDVAVVDATAEWLYDRIMEERKVWHEDHDYYVPPFSDVEEPYLGLWRDEADRLLAVIERKLKQ